MAYIIDTYNKYNSWDKQHSIHLFQINGVEYAIKKVEMSWGMPTIPDTIEQDARPEDYHIWEHYEDALAFAQEMRLIN